MRFTHKLHSSRVGNWKFQWVTYFLISFSVWRSAPEYLINRRKISGTNGFFCRLMPGHQSSPVRNRHYQVWISYWIYSDKTSPFSSMLNLSSPTLIESYWFAASWVPLWSVLTASVTSSAQAEDSHLAERKHRVNILMLPNFVLKIITFERFYELFSAKYSNMLV